VAGEELRWCPARTASCTPPTPQLQRLRTKLAMVFQHFNLWAHMTVLQNIIEAPVHVMGTPATRPSTARKYLAKVGWKARKTATRPT
jgi:arginine/ornithine transport system ATP-binding protein